MRITDRLCEQAERGSALWLLGIPVLALSRPGRPAAAAPDKAFVGDHCTGCHNAEDKKGRLDLTSLAFDPKEPANLAVWVRVHDRVAAGEMPPKSRPRPDAARQKAFVEGLAKSIVAAERAALAGEGRATLRRLNRHEYENALRDLLGVPWAQVASRLPEDGEAYRFNKSGEALDVSYLTMERFIDSANHALRLATATGLERPAKTTRKLYARDEPSLRNWWPRENGTLPDRLSFPVLDSKAQPDVRAGRAPATSPATREREAVGKVSSIFSDAGGYSWNGWRAPVAARYKLRIAGYTVWVAGGGVARWFYEGQGAEKAPVYHTLLWHRPNLDEVYPGRRNEPIGVYASGGGQTRPVGAVDFTPKPTVSEIEVFLLPGEVIRTDGSRLFRTRVNGTDEQYVNPLATEDGMPGYAVQWIEIEGPFYDDPVGGAGYRLLFDQLKLVPSKEPRTGVPLEIGPAPSGRSGSGWRASPGGPGGFGRAVDPRGALRGGVRGAAGGRRAAAAVVPETGVPPAGRRGRREAVPGAVRRPVQEGPRLHPVAAVGVLGRPGVAGVRVRRGETGPARRPRAGHAAGPVPVELDPGRHAAGAGRQGRTRQAGRAAAQTERMLPTRSAPVRRGVPIWLDWEVERGRRFVEAFTDYWLDLRKIDDTSPSTTLYNDYELDDPLKLAAVEETRLFFAELLRADLPARNVVDFGLHVPQRAAGRPLRHPGRRGRRLPQGDAAGRTASAAG